MSAAPAPRPIRRRPLLGAGILVLLLGPPRLAWGARVVAVRMWPSEDYTRLTIESDAPLNVSRTSTPTPQRLVLDIAGMDVYEGVRELVNKLRSDDPNVALIEVAAARPGEVTLTLGLKQPVDPQIFQLAPVATYQHRLVIDLYPREAPDPLDQLIRERMAELDAASARAARLLGIEVESTVPPPGARPELPADDPIGQLIAQRERERDLPAAAAPVPEPAPPGSAQAPPASPSAPAATVPRRELPSKRAPSAQPERTERLIIVALDPGHGGEDPGAIGPGGTREKDVVLQIALRLRDRINAGRVNGNPMRAYLTRDADYFVPLNMRVQKAQRVGADLFVSIHADAFMSPRPQGASVYALSTQGASSAAARWLADKENAADLVGGINVRSKDWVVQRTLLDMSTTAQIKDSLKLGSAMLAEVGRVGKLHKPRVEQAGFAVLKAPDIPSVLVETAFISNPDEERRLRSAAFQDALADALYRGIVRYFGQNPPLARSRQI
jgi:N-acetylmuramoyl-L-alanine amidase